VFNSLLFRELARYSKNLKKAKDEGVKKAIAAGVGLGLTMFMLFVTYAGALWFGGFLVSESVSATRNILLYSLYIRELLEEVY
jgi:hypothetical protein